MADTKDDPKNINQSHGGGGDNVAGDKTVTNDRHQQGNNFNDSSQANFNAPVTQNFGPVTQNFGDAEKALARTGAEPPNNLGDRGISNPKQFVGREAVLTELHKALQRSERVAIASVAGMGGVGKSELAVQYGRRFLRQVYGGGVVWVSGSSSAGLELLGFARSTFFPDEDFSRFEDLRERLNFCWNHWPKSEDSPDSVLLIFDDVTDYGAQVEPFLPSDSRFRVVVTTRAKLDGIEQLDLDVLKPGDALALLCTLAGEKRVGAEKGTATAICEWLGLLPLGIELVGYFLRKKPDLSLAAMLARLQARRVEAKALNPQRLPVGLTAQRGVLAAFEVSWLELGAQAQELAMRLSLFGAAPIPWELMGLCWAEADGEDLEEWRDEELGRLHLLDRKGEELFGLHPLVREFLQGKFKGSDKAAAWRSAFAAGLNTVAEQFLSQTMTVDEVTQADVLIPHLKEVTTFDVAQSPEACAAICDHLALFYYAQGLFDLAEEWGVRSLEIREHQLGDNHPDTATSLNNLAALYESQGRYSEAEPLYRRSLEIREHQLSDNHPSTAQSLNNLAGLYRAQGRYSDAEPLYRRSLEIREQQLGDNHP
ncbi:MAG: tetratricopeptide repeat protein, partial [Cyanobacteria bacterium P01_C01_bin.89]